MSEIIAGIIIIGIPLLIVWLVYKVVMHQLEFKNDLLERKNKLECLILNKRIQYLELELAMLAPTEEKQKEAYEREIPISK